MLNESIRREIVPKTSKKFKLSSHDPLWQGTPEMRSLSEKKLKSEAKTYLKKNTSRLSDAQERLYADNRYSILVLFQAMDAAGKDGTIKHVMSGVNPQGCAVSSFKKPAQEDLEHNFLWRYWRRMPERGQIGIFNRSYYEEVLVVRVHPELIANERLSVSENSEEFWNTRYEDINSFEKHMSRNGTIIIKFFLNLSKEEQRQRFIQRLTDETKFWKFSDADLVERGFWDDYQNAFEDMIAKTHTDWAPWYIIPADNKPIMRALVSHVITETIGDLNPQFPVISNNREKELKQALKALRAEE